MRRTPAGEGANPVDAAVPSAGTALLDAGERKLRIAGVHHAVADAHPPRLEKLCKLRATRQICDPDTGVEPERAPMGERERFFLIPDAADGDDGAERLTLPLASSRR